ncbi:DUF481 domain-containing protein [Beggiatoa leptomitoformis]|uniref:DUF481 domain-containing protein n=1 Tax=Beggiatoa leptomitoformis TaxID=288004 RepID=A0A2N9YGU4_9GAMM|nr:DUF481 domain-containing protein [Beggiatoa leptomitoformis]ALG67999.1 hypothetical protein AL038_10130 [Beggiatoa leptomitoformis]AUI69717.1 hypothetical protein BLE401_14150 [Beggiatoa leptomitoformis]
MKIKTFTRMTTVALLISSSVASAIELTDYVSPDSFFQQSYLSGSFNLNSGNQDQTSYNGTFAGSYDMTYSTLPFVWNVAADARTDFSRGKESDASTEKGYDVFASTTADKYFNNNSLLFGFGSADLGYRRLFGSDEADDPFAKLGVGVGYGRIYNATPLAKAIRIVEDLVKYKVLASEPSTKGYMELAGVIDRESEFISKYSLKEYKKYWVEAMEEVLHRDGVLKTESLGALGVIRIQEILFDERINQRKHGWVVRGGVGYIASNYDGSDSDPSLDVIFEYGLPIGLQWQLIERAEYSTILSGDIGHRIRNVLSLTYEITDAIDWENEWELDYLKPTDTPPDQIVSNTLSSTLRYYLSNRLSADLTLELRRIDDDIDDNGNDKTDKALLFGISYRLN